MAAPLKRLAKHSLAGAKKRVRLHPLSADDAVAVIFTVLNASPAPLFRAAAKSKQGKGLSKPEVFSTIIRTVLDHKHGAIYAAIVTSIDADDVFHSDQFAVSMKRLGIMDDIASQLSANGYDPVAELVKNKAPLFWAEISAQELETVRNELGGTYNRIIGRFIEDLDTDDIDQILEAQVTQADFLSLSPRLQFLKGSALIDLGPIQANFDALSRNLRTSQNLVLLDKNSTIEGTFSAFYQHLLTDMNALQRIIPRASFGGIKLSTQQFQKTFRDFQVQRRLKGAFTGAYDDDEHAVILQKLYQNLRRNNFYIELKRSAKTYANLTLTDDNISAIVSGIVGLFFAFAGDTKGQRFPLITKR
jgi:hypothetical protein